VSSKDSATKQPNAQGGQPAAEPQQTHIPPWKIILGVGILLALMIIGGFVLK
jgi:hypothetical protein